MNQEDTPAGLCRDKKDIQQVYDEIQDRLLVLREEEEHFRKLRMQQESLADQEKRYLRGFVYGKN